eukprot:scaffold259889_cov24-Tisochrysis_lutea.AAC.4
MPGEVRAIAPLRPRPQQINSCGGEGIAPAGSAMSEGAGTRLMPVGGATHGSTSKMRAVARAGGPAPPPPV